MAIDKNDNIIDSRDVIARLKELNDEREGLADTLQEARDALAEHEGPDDEDLDDEETEGGKLNAAITKAEGELSDWDDENGDERKELEAFDEEGRDNCSEWDDGATLIAKDHFTEYAEEMTKDIGDMPQNIPSYIVIDWEATAENLKADYTTVDWGDSEFYVRSC